MAGRASMKSRRKAADGTVFPAEAVARNVRGYRLLGRMRQEDLARAMTALDQGWTRNTVAAIEGGSRAITIDELWALALALAVPIGRLLDPTGWDNRTMEGIDLGVAVIPPRRAHSVAIGEDMAHLASTDGVPDVVLYYKVQPRYDPFDDLGEVAEMSVQPVRGGSTDTRQRMIDRSQQENQS